MTQKKLLVSNSEITRCIFGSFDKHARRLEEAFGVRIFNRADGRGRIPGPRCADLYEEGRIPGR